MIAGGNHTLIKQPCTEAPLKPASLGTFLPGQESTAPGRAFPPSPYTGESSPGSLHYLLPANQMLPGGRGKPLPYALVPMLAA